MALVLTQTEDGVCTLTLNRPERRNALSSGLIDAIHAGLDDAEADTEVRAIVLTGAGKGFCAGGDLAGGMAGKAFLEGHRSRGRYAELLGRIPRCEKPVVAAVNGDALGGGLGLVAACDLAIADPRARLGTPEIKVGLFPWIILAPLQRHVGRKALMELVLTGERVSADRALELGLLNRLSEEGQALADAQALARVVASRSPAIVALGKNAFARVADMAYDDALAYLHTQLTVNLLTEDAAEGIGAFLQKREPNWKGR
ncbi:MAG: enoyl-CoA hydratase/isomerase family protein [Proteobacteria bacterium]|nr:enoyl-CoA hydratase/isomerase family protein [Pseudomonadota bacterium]